MALWSGAGVCLGPIGLLSLVPQKEPRRDPCAVSEARHLPPKGEDGTRLGKAVMIVPWG